MLPTPTTSHIDPTHIYEPSTDSYLFLDVLPSERPFLSSRFPASSPAPLILEVGTGSGIIVSFVTANASAIFGHAAILTLGVDANGLACAATGATVALATTAGGTGSYLGSLVGDLTAPLRGGMVDVLLFNPPYVPTAEVPSLEGEESSWEEESRLLALTYAGGEEGMEVTRRLLGELEWVLSARGVAYVLFCAQNRPREVLRRMEGWRAELVGESGREAGWERLGVWRVWRG